MKTLMSLEQCADYLVESLNTYEHELKFNKTVKYNEQLKQIPQLNRFIPAIEKDGGWVVLRKPKFFYTEENLKSFTGKVLQVAKEVNREVEQYQSALNNVWFDGWEIVDHSKNQTFRTKSICYKGIINAFWWRKETGLWELSKGINSYSDLTKYNLPLNDNGVKAFNL